MGRAVLVGLAGCAIVLAAACGGDEGGDTGTLGRQATRVTEAAIEEETGLKNVLVLEINSATKINVHRDGFMVDIRYIGITVSDPEKVLNDGRTVREAAFDLNYSAMTPLRREIQLEKGEVERDVVGNFLRYVYVDGKMINLTLVTAGLATVKDNPSDTTHQAELLAAQEDAKANERGVWEP